MPNKVNLNQIVNMLHPINLMDRVLSVHLLSRRNYPAIKLKVKDYDEFKKEIIKFFKYHHANIIGPVSDEDMIWGTAYKILESKYGHIKSAVAAAQSGLENGLEGCLDTIYEYYQKEQLELFTASVISLVDPTSFNDRLEISRQILSRFNGYIPPPFNMISEFEIAAGGTFENFLRSYVQHVTSISLSLL